VSAAAATLALSGLAAGAAQANPPDAAHLGAGVPHTQPRQGHPANLYAPGVKARPVAVGTDALENPLGLFTNYGVLGDVKTQPVEATRTEPDQNTYLVFPDGLNGPEPGYDYGTHFVFQGHEGTLDRGYVTRVNLDVHDPAHRITLLTTPGPDGKSGIGDLDGSTWDPFARKLLVTSEAGATTGGVFQLPVRWTSSTPPATVQLTGDFGRGGFEGIHPDARGNVWAVEDVGGTSTNVVKGDTTSPKSAKQPNSFIYRLIPVDPSDLTQGGKLQALQVTVSGHPLTFHATDVAGDVFGPDQATLRDGAPHAVRWVTVHDTATDGSASFDANAAAKAAGATPFKRPENGAFRPGSGFRTFVFAETGDTNADSGQQPALAARGAWGSLLRIDLDRRGNRGTIRLLASGDATHASFDNVTWADADHVMAAEDRGDGLHTQLNTLDSAWVYDVRHAGRPPVRLIAEGRDPFAEADAGFGAASTPGFQNEGDNEITGLDVSDGRVSAGGLLGRSGTLRGARWFFTQQHGMNVTYSLTAGHGARDARRRHRRH
jgi:Bacterial protein of unknown function (DUF839)